MFRTAVSEAHSLFQIFFSSSADLMLSERAKLRDARTIMEEAVNVIGPDKDLIIEV